MAEGHPPTGNRVRRARRRPTAVVAVVTYIVILAALLPLGVAVGPLELALLLIFAVVVGIVTTRTRPVARSPS
jgi:hypothetical protein